MKAPLDFPCPQCAEPLVFDAAAGGRQVVCPACDALVTMPPPSSNSPRPAKAAVPGRRGSGKAPRAFAEESDPAGADAPLAPPPPDLLAGRIRTALPTQRDRDRHLPSMTPAPYQAESTTAARPGRRAELPGRRGMDTRLPFRANPTVPVPPSDDRSIDSSPAPAADDPEPSTASPRPANHRLGAERRLEFQPQESVNFDPEDTGNWGSVEGDAEASRTRSRKLILWAVAIAIPLAGAVIWQSLHRTEAPPVPPEAVDATANRTQAAEEVRRASDVVSQFLATQSIDERAAFVRHPEVTKPRMERWHTAANPLKPAKPLRFNDRSSEQTIDDATFVMLSMELDDFTGRAVAVEKVDASFKIDWESFVSWSEMPWPEFLTKEPAEPAEFRVAVEIDNYWNFGYKDKERMFCYKLTDPGNWASCWGYCGIDSEAGAKLNRMIRRQRQQGHDQIKAIIRLQFEDAGRGHNQVAILDVLQDGWVKAAP